MAVPFSEPRTFIRYPEGAYVDGEWVQPAPGSVTIRALIQPFMGTRADMEMLNRLGIESLDGLRRVHAEAPLQVANPQTGSLGDRFTEDGVAYHIISCSKWPPPRPHWRGIARVIDPTTDVPHSEPEPEPEPEPETP